MISLINFFQNSGAKSLESDMLIEATMKYVTYGFPTVQSKTRSMKPVNIHINPMLWY